MEDSRVTLALEMAKPLAHLASLCASLPERSVRIAYDVGQATALGADPLVDLGLLGAALGQVRVRDVTPAGRRVRLGQGCVDLPAVARYLAGREFAGWWVLEKSPGADPREAVRADVALL